jgi:hypothetical protein
VEGEDFRIKCPDWCVPVQEAAWPEEVGWYLAIWLFDTFDDDQGPQPEFVYVEHNDYKEKASGDPWSVYELGSCDPSPALSIGGLVRSRCQNWKEFTNEVRNRVATKYVNEKPIGGIGV